MNYDSINKELFLDFLINNLFYFLNFTFKWIDKLIPKLKDTGSFYVFNTPFNSAYILQYLNKKDLVYGWHLGGGNVFQLLKWCYQYLIVKPEQADIAFDFQKTMIYCNSVRIPDEVLDYRRELKI